MSALLLASNGVASVTVSDLIVQTAPDIESQAANTVTMFLNNQGCGCYTPFFCTK